MTVIEDEIMGLSYFKHIRRLNYDNLLYYLLLFILFLSLTANVFSLLIFTI